MNLEVEVTRREFLEISAAVVGVFSELRMPAELSAEQRATLIAVVCDLFPHPGANDHTYDRAANAIIERCRRDGIAHTDVTQGIAILDRCCAGHYAMAGARRRFTTLTMLRDSGFFHT